MDWFYPILCGVHEKQAAKRVLRAKWKTFVESEKVRRCVADEPWITAAETSELTITLASLELREDAVALLEQDLMASRPGWWLVDGSRLPRGHFLATRKNQPGLGPQSFSRLMPSRLTDGHRLFKDHL